MRLRCVPYVRFIVAQPGPEIAHDVVDSESMQRDCVIFLWARFWGKLARVFGDMWRPNRTAGSNPSRSATKALTSHAFPDLTEESYEMRRIVRALARGAYCVAKERSCGEPHSTPFGGIFSGAR